MTLTRCTALVPKMTAFFAMKQKCFMHITHFITQNIRKAQSVGLRYSKLAIFTISSRTFLSKTGPFLLPLSLMVNNAITTGTTWGNCLAVRLRTCCFTHHCPLQCKSHHKWKEQIMPQNYHKDHFNFASLLKGV